MKSIPKKCFGFLFAHQDPHLEQDLFSEIIKRRLASSWGNVFLLLIVLFSDFEYSKNNLFSFLGVGAFVIVLSNLLRTLFHFSFEQRRFYYAATLFSFFGWTILGFSIFLFKDVLDIQTVVTIIVLSGVASSAASSLAPIPLISIFGIIFTVLIPGSFLFFKPNGFFIGSTSILFTIYLFSHSIQIFHLLLFYFSQRNELVNEQRLIQNTLDSIPGFFSILSPDLKYLLVNKYVLDLCHLDINDFIGKPVGFMGNNPEFKKRITEFIESKKNHTSQRFLCTIKNETRWFSLNLTQIPGSGEILLLALDIQEQVQLEEQNTNQKIKLEQSQRMAEVGLISGGISHEINNPLAIIIGKLSLLKRKVQQDPPPSKDFLFMELTKIEETSHRIVRIIRSIMSFAHPNNTENMIRINAIKLMEDVKDFTFERLKSSGITLDISIPEELDLICRPTQISQVLVNLIGNARDALKDTLQPKIRVSFQKIENKIKISVEDNGPGISPENRDKVLLPFFTTKEPGSGTGLGLSISGTIIKAHQGTLTIEDSVDLDGAHFIITLPDHPEA
ncbi:MAG TPA: ATP-binding protein [Pseudobdellovibrionaceae bacterium]|nr:ATP-binding protein [Pseudobdellovibrionaceae bacterium]